MKKIFTTAIIFLSGVFVSCHDWLTELPPTTETLSDYYIDGQAVPPIIVGCYSPLEWDNHGTYIPEWFIGDACSDDALKGGQDINDMHQVRDMEEFKVNADNQFLLYYFRVQYIGIARCNEAIRSISAMQPDEYMDAGLKARYISEAKFLRAFYYFRLVRLFGKVPLVLKPVERSTEWNYERAPLADIYGQIVRDLTDAEAFLPEKSEYDESEAGHATKGAAQAMLLKTYLTGHEHLENAYENAVLWASKICPEGGSTEYTLCGNYWDNFTLAGENGPESVFEIQFTHDPQSGYGSGGDLGGGYTRGTFSVILTRSRSEKLMGGQTGWGFNRPSPNLFDAYEEGDPRRDLTIYTLKDEDISNKNVDIYLYEEDSSGNVICEGVPHISLKYAMMEEGDIPDDNGRMIYRLPHHSRGPINCKVIRYADVLLMYAEACCHTNNQAKAKELLEMVRNRARHGDDDILPEFPNYNGYTDTDEDLLEAIRHERRVELAMEGHRWFDLNRWGILGDVMDAIRTDPKMGPLYPNMQPFKKGVHEIFPIPAEERRLGGLDQNDGY